MIDRDAVGVLEILLHAGEIIDDGLLALLACDEVGDVVHGTRTVEGVHCDEVLECAGLQFDEVLLHTCRLKLEGSCRAAFAVELVGFWVIDGDGLDVEVDAARDLDIFDRVTDDRQGLQS